MDDDMVLGDDPIEEVDAEDEEEADDDLLDDTEEEDEKDSF